MTPPPTTTDTPDADVIDLAGHRADATAAASAAAPEQIIEIPLDRLEPDPDNVRGELRDVDGIAKSIAKLGVLQPLTVAAVDDGRWRIRYGHRRYAGARRAGLATVPCIVRAEVTDAVRISEQLVENLQRDDLTPIEEALGYQALIDDGESQRKIAERVSRNQSHISKRLKLLTLPAKAQAAVVAGELTVEEGLVLTQLAEHPVHVSEAMATLVTEREYDPSWTMALAVEQQLRLLQNEAARLEALAQLDADGIRIVDWPGNHGHSGWPAGHRRLDASHIWPNYKPPTRAKVAKGGHLAAAVDERGSIVYLCTDASKYETKAKAGSTTTGTSARSTQAEESAARRALNKRKRADAQRRLDVAGRHIRNATTASSRAKVLTEVIAGDGRLGKPTDIWLQSMLGTWLGLIGYVRSSATKTALELLELAKDHDLHRLAQEPEYAGRVELAVWVALAEERIETGDLTDPLVAGYYAWLGVLSPAYQLGDEEAADLEAATAKAKKARS